MEFLGIEVKEWIQIGIMLALLCTLIVSILQTRTQNRLFKAQLLRDRFMMYWKSLAPVSKEEIEELELTPEIFILKETYKKNYKGKPKGKEKIHKYIYLQRIYEYLAFAYAIRQFKVRDPLASKVGKWSGIEQWVRELNNEQEFPEFRDVHGSLKNYYPEFAKFVESLKTLGPRLTL